MQRNASAPRLAASSAETKRQAAHIVICTRLPRINAWVQTVTARVAVTTPRAVAPIATHIRGDVFGALTFWFRGVSKGTERQALPTESSVEQGQKGQNVRLCLRERGGVYGVDRRAHVGQVARVRSAGRVGLWSVFVFFCGGHQQAPPPPPLLK